MSDDPGDTIAAPYMFYRDGYYWVLVETRPSEVKKIWNTEAFYSTDPLDPFMRTSNSPVLVDDEACPFPYIENNTLYLYECHRCSTEGWGIKLYTHDFQEET